MEMILVATDSTITCFGNSLPLQHIIKFFILGPNTLRNGKNDTIDYLQLKCREKIEKNWRICYTNSIVHASHSTSCCPAHENKQINISNRVWYFLTNWFRNNKY